MLSYVKSAVLVYGKSLYVSMINLSGKLLILLSQFPVLIFFFLFIPRLAKMRDRWNLLAYLHPYIKIL